MAYYHYITGKHTLKAIRVFTIAAVELPEISKKIMVFTCTLFLPMCEDLFDPFLKRSEISVQ